MPFLDDVIEQLESEGVGTLNLSIFAGSKQSIPVLPNAATLAIRTTGGTAPEHTHNATVFPAVLRPTAQLVARANVPAIAYELADAAFQALVKVRNRFIGVNFYRSIKGVQSEPFDLGVDDRGQAQYAFNVIAEFSRRD